MDNNLNESTDSQKEQSVYSGNYEQSSVNQGQQTTYSEEHKQSSIYQQTPDYQNTEFEEPISMGHWFLSLLVCMIPCVNIVVMFVWAFSPSEKKSKSNFFKAALIWCLIQIVLSIIFFTLIIGTVATQMMYY